MAKELTKKQAPKQTEVTPEAKKVAPNNAGPAPMPVAAKSEKDIAAENKAIKKAEKQAKKDEKVLHFHPLMFILHFIIFALCTVTLVFGVKTLLDATPESNANVLFTVGAIIMLTFPIWMAEFQLGYRRFFRIGKYERMRKAIAKKELKASK